MDSLRFTFIQQDGSVRRIRCARLALVATISRGSNDRPRRPVSNGAIINHAGGCDILNSRPCGVENNHVAWCEIRLDLTTDDGTKLRDDIRPGHKTGCMVWAISAWLRSRVLNPAMTF